MEKVTFIDGSTQEQTEALKNFFGLRPDQTFQDLDVDIDEDDNDE